MKTRNLSFINIAVLAALVLAAVSVWSVSRHSTLTFSSTEELVVYPEAAETLVNTAPITLPPAPIIAPKVLFTVLPQYPAGEIKSGHEGTVLLKVSVSDAGRVNKIDVKSSSGFEKLDGSAVSAVSCWKFSAASRGTQKIASFFEVPVRFDLN
jgi:protein TonB